LGRAAGPAGDDRQPCAHPLQDHLAEGFREERGVNEDVHGTELTGDVRPKAGELHASGKPELRREPTQLVLVRLLAEERSADEDRRFRAVTTRTRARVEEDVLSLPRGDPPDHAHTERSSRLTWPVDPEVDRVVHDGVTNKMPHAVVNDPVDLRI